MNKGVKILLIAAAIACFGIALYYPIHYGQQESSNASNMEELVALRLAGMASEDQAETTDANGEAGPSAELTRTAPAEPEAPGAAEAPEAQSEAPADEVPGGKPESEIPSGEAQEEAPASEPQDEAPVSEAQSVAPASEAREEAPASEAQGVAPASESQGEAPASEAQGVAPANEAQGEAASDESQAIAFVSETQGEAPVSESQGAAPANEAQSEAPASESQGEAAVQSQTTESTSTIPGGEDAAAAVATVQSAGGPAGIAATSPKPIAAAPSGEPSVAKGGEASVCPEETAAEPEETPSPEPTPTPSPTPNRRERSGAMPYSAKEKVEFDESKILGRYKAIYGMNKDFIGWITIPGTDVDYPVVQTAEDGDYYLHHDFFGDENNNGQIILDPLCDPYTPSYNLVISGHNMRSGSMFGNLDNFTSESYWRNHKFIQFDTLMNERHYVIMAAFYSADYDIDEKGFRYNADIQYRMEAEQWLEEVEENRLYDTGIDAEFGDEFLTLTTCNYARRKDGRFVLVCRRIREGETFE